MECARDGCENVFTPKKHNQKYCSSDCMRLATNERILGQYYERKEIKHGKLRVCLTRGCSTVLSRYNPDKTCAGCQAKAIKPPEFGDTYGS